MTYTLTQAECRNAKSALTRAVNSGDPEKLLATCQRARLLFDAKGYPDSWSNWRRALWDAAGRALHGNRPSYEALADEAAAWD